MGSIARGAAAGALIGAVALGAAAVAGLDVPGIAAVLQYLPPETYGDLMARAASAALVGGVGGGVFGAAVGAAAREPVRRPAGY